MKADTEKWLGILLIFIAIDIITAPLVLPPFMLIVFTNSQEAHLLMESNTHIILTIMLITYFGKIISAMKLWRSL